jgi:hypothetical protein
MILEFWRRPLFTGFGGGVNRICQFSHILHSG